MMAAGRIGGEALRYSLSGIAATGLHAVIAMALITSCGFSPALANGIAFATASTFSYLANALWTFRAGASGRNLGRFAVTIALSASLAACVAHLAEMAGLHNLAGILVVALTVPVFTFFMHRLYTFRP